MPTIQIDVHYDFICPWGWIGQRNLAAALAEAGIEHTAEVAFRYVPFELNPDMPSEGMDRRAYRSQKFGSWARSQMRDAQASAAGLVAGVRFDYDKVLRTPNTRIAHRLMQLSQQRTQSRATAALCEAIFAAYFSAGRDIGSPDVLLEIAASYGLDTDDLRAELLSARIAAPLASHEPTDGYGFPGVPAVVIDGHVISGAQPPAVFVDALHAAAQRFVFAGPPV
ncbi:DSBA oxidoreductase [Caballeronia calidae]|uniref:DSBA oxidoreductase n=1 Tax=Caballeronia calidae TaxID=1777139 RepID=A0A158EBN4_9BURK|nr:DsbA family oxidoreductase [Caballeronia calidae]SAL04258.1 DSBA oxidoreductase [Caballeronia calidae]